jgi:hypothetical protein
VVVGLVARSLIRPSLLGFLGTAIGSEFAQFIWCAQVWHLKRTFDAQPALLGSWAGKLVLGVNFASLSIIFKNLVQGIFLAPREFTSALREQAGIDPKISNSRSWVSFYCRSIYIMAFALLPVLTPVCSKKGGIP